MKISLDFSARYCIVGLFFLFLQEKMNSQILKNKNPGEKEFAEKNAENYPLANPFLSLIPSPAVSCTDNSTT